MASGPKSKNESAEVVPIGELIRAERARSGLSYQELAARAENAGYSVKFQYLNDLANAGPKSWPKNPDTFRGLATALQLTVREIVLSYAVSLGLDIGGTSSRLAAGLPDAVDSLAPEVTDALLSLIRTLADQNSLGEQHSLTDQHSPAAPAAATDKTAELGLAADSSKNRGKEMNTSIAALGEGTQELRRKR